MPSKVFLDIKLKKIIFRYQRDYYINDSTKDDQKRYSYGSSISKSPSFEDEVSDENFNHQLHSQHHERDFLVEKLLNSNFDSVSMSSRNSRDSSERDFSIPKEVLKQLESRMLHTDLKRESFRARTATKNFCLNPLFEEGFGTSLSDAESNYNFDEASNVAQSAQTLPSTTSSLSSMEDMKSNCVENIFIHLGKVRSSSSFKSVDSDRPRFVTERCHSLKRSERKLK